MGACIIKAVKVAYSHTQAAGCALFSNIEQLLFRGPGLGVMAPQA